LALNNDEYVLDVVGPWENVHILKSREQYWLRGGGVGIAPLMPIVKGFKEAGNNGDYSIGSKNIKICLYLKMK
jgi:NAD(P)H-flavin reductase